MRKVIFGTLFLGLIGLAVVGCKKESKQLGNNIMFHEGRMDDDQLINLLKDYKNQRDIEELEDILLSNCSFSDDVLIEIVKNYNIPDFMVEEFVILSAPISNLLTESLMENRPKMNLETIIDNKSLNMEGFSFSIVNTNPRNIIIAKDLVYTSNSECNECGEGTFGGDNLELIILSNTNDINYEKARKKCDSRKWICGTTKQVKLISSDGNTAEIETTCENSDDKCIKRPKNALSAFSM